MQKKKAFKNWLLFSIPGSYMTGVFLYVWSHDKDIQLARLRWDVSFFWHILPHSHLHAKHLKKLWKFIFWGLLPTPSPVFSTQRTVLSAVPATVSVWFHTANDLLYSLQGHVTTASEKAHSTHTMPYTQTGHWNNFFYDIISLIYIFLA